MTKLGRDLTDEEIEVGKTCTTYSLREGPHHEHPDCIRMAYEWLDAQPKLKTPNKRQHLALKHIIERWGGRYVSTTDVDVAAQMHPDIIGEYPYFNLSSKLVWPNERRLETIGEAGKHGHYRDDYRGRERKAVYGTRAEP